MKTLKRAGYSLSFDVVDSPENFQARLSQTDYDVILSDHNLVTWTGMEALELLQKSGKDIPLLVLTATLGDEAAVDYVKRGATDYILKHRLDRLPVAVGRALKEKAHRDEAHRLQEQILAGKREWELTFDAVPDPVYVLDQDCLIQRVNRAAAETLGLEFSQLIGRPCYEALHGLTEPPSDCPHHRLLQGGQNQRGDIEEPRLGKIFDVTSTLLRDRSGAHRGSIVVWRDITDRRQAEDEVRRLNNELQQRVRERTAELENANQQLEQRRIELEGASKFKDQFLSTMSHELRTPLNAVMGFSELLSDARYGPLSEKQQRYVSHIHSGGNHLLRLINDVLDLSKIEAGRMELAIESALMESTFEEVLADLRPLADKKSQVFSVDCAPALTVRADAMRLKQVLMNLVGNAIKFTPEGGRIALQARPENGTVRVEVRDTGPGILPEEQKRIFEAFVRLQKPGAASEGTGLGLAITQRLVELHGGRMGLESEPGKGSCFYFSL
ncbi:MAG: PAS domain-containing protein, partial [Acidobacteria bacterium]|nr:PAS domain-containing protein [Acidobacteriota bacterium]